MEKQQSRYTKWIQIGSGCLMLLSQFAMSYIRNSSYSRWDYEGFDFMNMMFLFLGIISILSGLYLFYKKDLIKRWDKINLSLTGLFIVGSFVPMFLLIYSGNNFKYQLPLKKIETTQIEGTLVSDAKLRNQGPSASIYLGEGLLEYPNTYFTFSYFGSLQNELVDFDEYEEQYAGSRKLPEGTKVKLQIRTTDYEQLLAAKVDDEDRLRVSVYEFAVGDKVLLRKKGLK